MSAYTPGPWLHAHREGADGMFRTEVFSSEYGGIAICDWTPKHIGNGVTATYRVANARLIAAAPDLLEALQALSALPEYDGTGTTSRQRLAVKDQVRAAIAKATGESA